MQNDREWRRFCKDVLGDEGIADDKRFRTNTDRVANRGAMNDAINGVFGPLNRDRVKEKLKAAGAQAIVKLGGTISHQHGVGRDHARYLPAEKGELGIAAIHGLVEVFDPSGQMNPGKLLPD